MRDPAETEDGYPPRPDTSHLITENDDPVDNIPSEKNQRLLASSLYASWAGAPPIEIEGEPTDPVPRPFLATANVGLFDRPLNDPLVPDLLVSNDVQLGDLRWDDSDTKSYFIWDHGKPPELVVEIVSNKKGGELTRKRLRYGKMRVAYYVVFDPGHFLGDISLRAFRLAGDRLEPLLLREGARVDIEPLGLEIGVWTGTFEQRHGLWLRFFDKQGNPLLTGEEKAENERQKAENERQRAENERQKAENERQKAENERQRAENERARADALAEKLRSLGIDPDQL